MNTMLTPTIIMGAGVVLVVLAVILYMRSRDSKMYSGGNPNNQIKTDGLRAGSFYAIAKCNVSKAITHSCDRTILYVSGCLKCIKKEHICAVRKT